MSLSLRMVSYILYRKPTELCMGMARICVSMCNIVKVILLVFKLSPPSSSSTSDVQFNGYELFFLRLLYAVLPVGHRWGWNFFISFFTNHERKFTFTEDFYQRVYRPFRNIWCKFVCRKLTTFLLLVCR